MKKWITLILITASLQVQATPQTLHNLNVEQEVERVKTQLNQIQSLPITRELKMQQRRALLEKEISRIQTEISQQEIYDQEAQNNRAAETRADSKAFSDAAHDRKKTARENLQKLLDILRSMNPKL